MNKLLTAFLLVIVGCTPTPKETKSDTVGNTSYKIKPNEQAIVFRGKTRSHIVKPGMLYLTPEERIKVYDLSKVYSGEVGTEKYILFNKEMVELNATFKWRICDPKEHADNFQVSGFDIANNKRVMSNEMKLAIRVALYDEKVTDLNEIETEEFYGATFIVFEKRAKSYGVCLVHGPNASDKAIFFKSIKLPNPSFKRDS